MGATHTKQFVSVAGDEVRVVLDVPGTILGYDTKTVGRSHGGPSQRQEVVMVHLTEVRGLSPQI